MKFPEPTSDHFIDRVDRSPERLDRGSRLLKVCPEAAGLGFEIGDPIFDRRLGLYGLRQQRGQPAAQRRGLLDGLRVRRRVDRVFAKIAHDEGPGSPPNASKLSLPIMPKTAPDRQRRPGSAPFCLPCDIP